MSEFLVLRVVIRLLLPFIVLYGLYVQFHGEYSPGGGFQAGIIIASAFIALTLVYDLETVKRLIAPRLMQFMCAAGVLLYAGVGVVSMHKGDEFLYYSALAADAVSGQKIGIFTIELGVGLTVFSAAMLIFYPFANPPE